MKTKDFELSENIRNRFGDKFIFMDEWESGAEAYNSFVKKLIRKSEDTKQFFEVYLDKNVAKENGYYKTSIYQTLLEEYGGNLWYYYREMFGDKCRKTWSDAGALKIGNENFSMLVRNGHGDGEMRYAVLDESEYYANSIMRFFSIVKGNEINIYSYDCGDEIDATISGRYCIYVYEGLVAIVRIKD